MNDPYVQRSKADGYRSRAAYKLIEIDDRYKLLKPGMKVIDLGAAPGGWCQVAAARTNSTDRASRMSSASTISSMDPVPGATVLKMDFLDDAAPAQLVEVLGGEPDIVLSDMAAPTTGHRRTDHIRTMHLCEVAADFAISVLKPGGHFLAKTFQGGTEHDAARPAEAEFPLGPPRQAAGVARRVGRALPAGQGLQGQGATRQAGGDGILAGRHAACDGRRRSCRHRRAGRRNGSTESAVMAPTMMKAMEKSPSAERLAGEIGRAPRGMPPPTATPSATLICCETAAMAVAWLASVSSMSAKTSALDEVKNSERRKPEPTSTAMMTPCGVSRREEARWRR